MPTYRFRCNSCKDEFDETFTIAENHEVIECTSCWSLGVIHKIFSAPTISLHGDGFYSTDNA